MNTEQTQAPLFDPPVVLASLSGRSDAEWAANATAYAGAAILGGIAIDKPTRDAAREMRERDRKEFLPPDPIAFVDEQLATLSSEPITAGINVRTTSHEPLAAVAQICCDRDAILEINAHCRQAEICQCGAGESLLSAPERLCAQVRTANETGATTSVKVRTEVPGVDLPALAHKLEHAGADIIHVDAMDSESVIEEIVEATTLPVIANNEVRDRGSAFEYLDYGAAAVSVGRPSDDPAVLSRVHDAATAWFQTTPTGQAGSTQTVPSQSNERPPSESNTRTQSMESDK